ncbi:hypothetical protein D3C80_892700 [compost metagenome]
MQGPRTVTNGLTKGLNRLACATRGFVAQFAAGTRGNVAMLFALALPVLLMMTLGAIDIHQASKVRANLQDALDAAALAAARSNAADADTITKIGMAALKANMPGYFETDENGKLIRDHASFVLANKVVVAEARVQVKVLVANIVLPPYGKLLDDYLPVSTQSQVDRSSRNVEVGLVLDITGSMDSCRRDCPPQSKLQALQAAAKQLVTIVVQTDQTHFYSRMAIIPYSTGVNMGSYAADARGAPLGPMTITGATWSTGSQKSISSITVANTGVVNSSAHGFQNGDFVWISDIVANSGKNSERMSQLNNRAYRVANRTTDSFSLESFNGSSWSTVSTKNYVQPYSGGIIRKCLVSGCSIVITSPNHGMTAFSTDTAAGDKERPSTVYIAGVEGLTQANGASEIANVTTDSFSISRSGGNGVYKTGTGQAWCGQNGCEWRIFRKGTSSSLTSMRISDCVTERIGGAAYTSASPGASPVGRKYDAVDCPAAVIQPLTSNRKTLTDLIDGLVAKGGTAGQIGLAWGWYAVSESFNSLWPTYFAGPKNAAETIKSVILMTDGEFNVNYCSGVNTDDIDCSATNGNPFAQATELCTNMKADGIIVYTVGFQIDDANAASILKSCASGPDRAYLPQTGDDLSKNFAEIGQDITRLRISR